MLSQFNSESRIWWPFSNASLLGTTFGT
eukprot:COSAG06_NODE_66172_length_255_cov_0.647436_1_plen_27_part_10